jgi:sec-independent protein translocase protein TatA
MVQLPLTQGARTRRPPEATAQQAERGLMPNIGIPELIIILVIVILIFGANRLPEIGRGIGKGIRNFKDATKGEGAEKG